MLCYAMLRSQNHDPKTNGKNKQKDPLKIQGEEDTAAINRLIREILSRTVRNS
jgi:hypothetical protein